MAPPVFPHYTEDDFARSRFLAPFLDLVLSLLPGHGTSFCQRRAEQAGHVVSREHLFLIIAIPACLNSAGLNVIRS